MIDGLDLSIGANKRTKHLHPIFLAGLLAWHLPIYLGKRASISPLVPCEIEISRLPKGLWRLLQSIKAGISPFPNPFIPGRWPWLDCI